MGHISATGFYMVQPVELLTTVKYGLLYNWLAVNDARNICSEGWHVPTRIDWQTLRTYLGGAAVAGGKLKETGTTYWNSPNTGATNEVGFNLRGNGSRGTTGSFGNMNIEGLVWTNTEYDSDYAYEITISYNLTYFNLGRLSKHYGLAVRLVRDATEDEQLLDDGAACTNYVGNDLKQYRTAKIGTQIWLADNLAETKFRNGDDIPIVTDNATWAALTTGALCAYNNDWNNV